MMVCCRRSQSIMLYVTCLVGLLASFTATSASPFKYTDEYIKEYENGINELKELALKHEHVEEKFISEKFNETHASHGKSQFN